MVVDTESLEALSGMDDAEVIRRSHGAPDAFALLFDRHAAALHRYVTRRLGEALADDIVAETFLAAFRRRDRYDPGRADARPWLYGMAANLIGHHRRWEVRSSTWHWPGPGSTRWRRATRTGWRPACRPRAVHRDLAEALAALSADDREVLLLVAWAEFSYEEVARALDIPLGTVRSRLHRARKRTRAALGGVDPTAITDEEAGRG